MGAADEMTTTQMREWINFMADHAGSTKSAVELSTYVVQHMSVITNALSTHVDYMRTNARRAMEAYEAGHSDGIMSNEGYRMSAEVFTQDADKAKAVYDNLIEMMDGDGDGEEGD